MKTMGDMYPRLKQLPGYEEIAASPYTGPTLIDKAVSLTKAVAKHVADPRTASPEVQDERKAICESCDNLDKQADRCRVCGCSAMTLKRSWPTERCPLDPPKWDVV